MFKRPKLIIIILYEIVEFGYFNAEKEDVERMANRVDPDKMFLQEQYDLKRK